MVKMGPHEGWAASRNRRTHGQWPSPGSPPQAMDFEVGHVTFPETPVFSPLWDGKVVVPTFFAGRDPCKNSWINEDNVLLFNVQHGAQKTLPSTIITRHCKEL